MDTEKQYDEFEKQWQQDKWARGVLFGGIIMYAGGILFGLFRNMQLFAPTFAGVDYAQVGYFAVILLACNAFVLPLFIHKRASGAQFVAAIIFYVVEMTVYVMNAAVEPRVGEIVNSREFGFMEWYYWNVAFVAPILIMVFWGVLFLLDPESKMSRAIAEARGELIGTWSRKTKVLAAHTDTTEKVQAQAKSYVDVLGQKVLPRHSVNGNGRAYSSEAEPPSFK